MRTFKLLSSSLCDSSVVSFLIKDEEEGDNEDVLGEGDPLHNPDDDLVRGTTWDGTFYYPFL